MSIPCTAGPPKRDGLLCGPVRWRVRGSVRLKQAVDTVRAAEPNVVLLDAGDEFQGTLFYTQFKGDVAAGGA